MSSGRWPPFCLDLYVSTRTTSYHSSSGYVTVHNIINTLIILKNKIAAMLQMKFIESVFIFVQTVKQTLE